VPALPQQERRAALVCLYRHHVEKERVNVRELGISFSKGDEIAVTGSKIKQEASDVILARELVKRTDTFLFRDDKGNPVWVGAPAGDWHGLGA